MPSLKKQRHSRKGILFKSLTKDVGRYMLVYVDVVGGEKKTLGVYSSLKKAKQALKRQQINIGVYHIVSHTNRVLYSTEGGEIDAE